MLLRSCTLVWPVAVGALNDDSPWQLGFLNFNAALTKPTQLNLPRAMLVLIELRYPFVAAPHIAWLNSVVFFSFPVFRLIDFQMIHDLLPWPMPSKVTWPSHQNVNARSTCMWNGAQVSVVLIRNRVLYYSSCWKRKNNKVVARFVEAWYSNRTINVVEICRKSLKNKGAMKNIRSDYLW